MTGIRHGARFSRIQFSLALAALLVVAGLAWLWLLAAGQAMATMRSDAPLAGLALAMMTPGAAVPYLVATALMWLVMMVAMMTPAVLPMMLVFRSLDRGPGGAADALWFGGGYLVAWSAFGVLAALVQWWLHEHGLLAGMALAASPKLAGAILIAAGLWQLTPLKAACLAHCRGPMGFFLKHWRSGRGGALAMGLRHGLFCIGCCWMLMALMFAGGAMSVATMAALALFILAERVLPGGDWVSWGAGLGLLGLGAVMVW
ncbi:MAG: DUF2182 domain-containing protein [Gammaproteobacteria bacterium]|nr:DUF2182 domain-containing protein [Gammaproteobacteria bacterium]